MDHTTTINWEIRSANIGTAVNFNDAKRRVIHSYRDWLRSVRWSQLFLPQCDRFRKCLHCDTPIIAGPEEHEAEKDARGFRT
jgi:hypothetical protein